MFGFLQLCSVNRWFKSTIYDIAALESVIFCCHIFIKKETQFGY